MNRTVTHKHLKRQFEILEDADDLSALFSELQYSTLLLPADIEKDNLSFPILHVEDKIYVPVFTDIHEYGKCDFGGNFTLMPNDFNFYLDLLDERIDGIIIDVEGERFPLTRQIKEFVDHDYFFDFEQSVFTMKEIRQIKDSIDNFELEEFLKDRSNHLDYDSLMELLLKSDLFKVVLSKKDLSSKAENGVISLHDVGQLPSAITTGLTESYALIYSTEDEVIPKDSPMHPYLQLVNLPQLVNRVLLDDLDGIILNENSHNIMIPRHFLLGFLKNLICHYPDKYDDYVFVL